MPLLTQQPAQVSRREAALTARFLMPAEGALEAFFLDLRARTDATLPARLGPSAKPYPVGRCQEITLDVLGRLQPALRDSRHPGARALKAFLGSGGQVRCIWGILREQYFQTALQCGALYVDVSNDTVTVTKPKVEILPMEGSGMKAVQGPEDFARTAGAYWGMRVFTNTALPGLAPFLPMIGVKDGEPPQALSATHYMVELFCRDRFRTAEAWLADGPSPPPEVVEALRARAATGLLAASPVTGAAAAIEACLRLRASEQRFDQAWVQRFLAPVAVASPAE